MLGPLALCESALRWVSAAAAAGTCAWQRLQLLGNKHSASTKYSVGRAGRVQHAKLGRPQPYLQVGSSCCCCSQGRVFCGCCTLQEARHADATGRTENTLTQHLQLHLQLAVREQLPCAGLQQAQVPCGPWCCIAVHVVAMATPALPCAGLLLAPTFCSCVCRPMSRTVLASGARPVRQSEQTNANLAHSYFCQTRSKGTHTGKLSGDSMWLAA